MPKEKSQADYRHQLNVADQHGRKWLVTIEKETMQPCASIMPCFIVADEFLPPQKFLRFEDNFETGRRLFIEYSDWLRDLRESKREWTRMLHLEGRRLYGDAYDASKAPKFQQLENVGTPPLDEKIVRAMEDGDAQYLGVAPDEPEPPTRKLCGQCAAQIAVASKFCPECWADQSSLEKVGRALNAARDPGTGEFVSAS